MVNVCGKLQNLVNEDIVLLKLKTKYLTNVKLNNLDRNVKDLRFKGLWKDEARMT